MSHVGATEIRLSPAMTFAEVLSELHRQRHTGPVVVHMAQGSANSIEIPSEPTRIKLDKRREPV